MTDPQLGWGSVMCSELTGVPHAHLGAGDHVGCGKGATISILQLRALRHSEIGTEQLQSALNSRILIEQAKGILAERQHISIAEAFTLMRTYARDHNRLLSHVAKAVITQAPDIADLAMHPTPTTATTHPQAELPPRSPVGTLPGAPAYGSARRASDALLAAETVRIWGEIIYLRAG